jgi:hypothetical protein
LLVWLPLKAQPSSVNPFDIQPQGFVKNEGQITCPDGRAAADVLFAYASGEFSLHLKKTGFSLQLFHVKNSSSNFNEAGLVSEEFPILNNSAISISRVDVDFYDRKGIPHKRPKESEQVTAEEPLPGPVHYFISGKKITAAAFNKITYREVYPHIDLVFYASAHQGLAVLRYEYVLRPGAQPGHIVLAHQGASSLSTQSLDEVLIKTSLGEIQYTGLFAYEAESKQPVPCRFQLNGYRLGFTLASTIDKTIVIDPNISWGTYFGGEKSESNSFELDLDYSDHIIISGTTKSYTNIASEGAYQSTYNGGAGDIYLARFTPDGSRQWSTYFGGSENEISYGIAADRANNIIIVGNSESDGLTTPGVHQQSQAGNGDNLIAKFDSSGQLLWCSLLGGEKVEQGRAVTSDSAGALYFVGYTESESGIATSQSHDTSANGKGDGYIAKFTAEGKQVWGTFVGGDEQDRIHSVYLHQAHLYVLGTTESDTGIATPGAHQEVRKGKEDVLIALFDTSGSRIWSSYFGGTDEDHGRSIKLDSAGYVYFAGWTKSPDYIGTPGSHQPNWYESYNNNLKPYSDGFVAKFTAAGQHLWGTYYGGESNDQVIFISLDERSNIYCAGSTSSFDSIISFPPMIGPHGFSSDGLLAKLDSSGRRVWGTYFGGYGTDDLWSLRYRDNYVYLIGKTDSLVEMPPGAFQPTNHGGIDAFIFRLHAGDGCFDAYEPNDTFPAAVPIPMTTDVHTYGFTAPLQKLFDQDWYSFEMQAGLTYFKIELTDLLRDYNLKLYRSTGKLLMQSVNFDKKDERMAGRLHPGIYYLQVAPKLEEYDSLHCYRLKVIAGDQPFEDTGSKFYFTEDQVQFSLSPNPAVTDVEFSLYSPRPFSGSVFIYSNDSRLMKSYNISGNEGMNHWKAEVSDLPPALYHVILRTEELSAQVKLLIQAE